MNTLRLTGLLASLVLLGAFAGCVNTLSKDSNRLSGYQAYRNSDFDAARERFDRVLETDPTDWRSHYYVGMIAMNHDEDPARAQRHFDIAYTIYEGRATKRLNYEISDPSTGVPYPTRSELLDAAAEARYQQGREERLHAFLREAINNHGTVYDHLRMGRYMQKIGDHDTARAAYQHAARLVGPSDPEPYIQLADFYDGIGDNQRAVFHLRKAYTIDPEHRGVTSRLRQHGLVPGPTIRLAHDAEFDG